MSQNELDFVNISKKNESLLGEIKLTSSKSESNRVLIIKALCGKDFKIKNISDSDDTRLLTKILNSSENIINCDNAGTTLRFLTSFFAVKENNSVILTGSERMKNRPIKILVEALKELGANIEYLEKEGFPPLKITGKKISGGTISIDGSISSQYITSLLLIAPILESGLKIKLLGKISSKPYIDMTLKIMNYFGVGSKQEGDSIVIEKQSYQPVEYTVEADWSSASYWYALASFSENTELKIFGLLKNSLQGDSVIAKIMNNLGVETSYQEGYVLLKKGKVNTSYFEYDFSDCPDLAQTVAVVCFGLGISANLTGLESLRIKETDRIRALVNEISALGGEVVEKENSIEINSSKLKNTDYIIKTYKDHRMALAFSTLSMLSNKIKIENPNVVSKSYPAFFNDLEKLGFSMKYSK